MGTKPGTNRSAMNSAVMIWEGTGQVMPYLPMKDFALGRSDHEQVSYILVPGGPSVAKANRRPP